VIPREGADDTANAYGSAKAVPAHAPGPLAIDFFSFIWSENVENALSLCSALKVGFREIELP
jgi:hypothetical protein